MNLYIAQLINHFGQWTWLDAISYTISWWPFFTLLLVVIWLLWYRKSSRGEKQYLIALSIGIVFFYLINELTFKHLLTQYIWVIARPYIAYPQLIHAIWTQLIDSSFPSSHMASSLVLLTLWIWRSPKKRLSALIIALLVGFSRIHNGMHYPLDVLAGAVFWIIYALVWIRASKLIIKKRPIVK
jgi:undecaprenyl-diphosphatase